MSFTLVSDWLRSPGCS